MGQSSSKQPFVDSADAQQLGFGPGAALPPLAAWGDATAANDGYDTDSDVEVPIGHVGDRATHQDDRMADFPEPSQSWFLGGSDGTDSDEEEQARARARGGRAPPALRRVPSVPPEWVEEVQAVPSRRAASQRPVGKKDL